MKRCGVPVWNDSIGDVLNYVHHQGVCQEFSAAVTGSLDTVFCPNPLLVKRSGSLSPSHFSPKRSQLLPTVKTKTCVLLCHCECKHGVGFLRSPQTEFSSEDTDHGVCGNPSVRAYPYLTCGRESDKPRTETVCLGTTPILQTGKKAAAKGSERKGPWTCCLSIVHRCTSLCQRLGLGMAIVHSYRRPVLLTLSVRVCVL